MRERAFFLFLLFPFIAFAQNVSTAVTKRNILIEDFTGIKCGNCPDGHAIVDKLVLGHPDRIFPVAIHAGSYATVTALDKPDFIIEEGKTINEYFNIESYGYPIGMTNRRDMGSAGLVQSRSYWIPSCRQLSREDAEVNIWCNSTYNNDTRVITADVELYYTSDVEPGSSALCVSLLQSGILGPQAGADMGDEYVHNHVLRAMLTPVWGDTIKTSDRETLVKRHYEYTLPEVIGNVDTDPLHMNIVAYVIDKDKAVMNVNGCDVVCPEEMTLPACADLEEYKILPLRNNAFPYLECYLVNKGTSAISSAQFRLTIDDDEEYQCNWTAPSSDEEVAGLKRGYVRVPVDWPSSAVLSGCDYELQLTGLNGRAYAGATIKGSFGAMLNVGDDVSVAIKTDKYADDNTYCLLDSNGDIVAEYGPYVEGSAEEYTETIHFPEDGAYCFEVTDAWGNGISTPRGYLKWYDADGRLIASNTEITNWGYRIFFNYDSTLGIGEVESDGNEAKAVYNLLGQRVTQSRAHTLFIINGKKIVQ